MLKTIGRQNKKNAHFCISLILYLLSGAVVRYKLFQDNNQGKVIKKVQQEKTIVVGNKETQR